MSNPPRLDDDLALLLAAFRVFNNKGPTALREFLYEEQETRNQIEAEIKEEISAFFSDPSNTQEGP